jgi:CheY-like chemotaxis protein/HPt (histidine-containing phosphotransfer) domain-containing protein
MLLASSIIKRIIPEVNLTEIDNGLDAIAYCQQQTPDIIFMDIQMPGMNGYETTIEIRKMDMLRQTPIIALTAGNLKGERERCVEVGMNDFLAKPIIETMVAEMLDKWLLEKIENKSSVDLGTSMVDESRFDIQGLKEIAADDDAFLKEILTVAKKDILGAPSMLQDALKTGDIALLKLRAHSLKGVALSLGASTLAGSAASIEYCEEIDRDDIIATIDLIQNEINYIVPLMNQHIEN